MTDDRTHVPDDRESLVEVIPPSGAPVDLPDVYADLTIREHQLRPIVPAALRNAQQRRMLAAWTVRFAAHRGTYHASRSPEVRREDRLLRLVGNAAHHRPDHPVGDRRGG